MASQITSLTIIYSSVYSGADQRKHQSSESLACGEFIHRWPGNSPNKGPVTRKMFPFDDVIMGHTDNKSWQPNTWPGKSRGCQQKGSCLIWPVSSGTMWLRFTPMVMWAISIILIWYNEEVQWRGLLTSRFLNTETIMGFLFKLMGELLDDYHTRFWWPTMYASLNSFLFVFKTNDIQACSMAAFHLHDCRRQSLSSPLSP